MSSHVKDLYGPNFRKAKRMSIARSSGKCQFCGLRKASEGHHWAWPDYPSDEEVQGHDITALCKTCHELATVLRDWVGREDAELDHLGVEIENCDNLYAKRAAFSFWLFPDIFLVMGQKHKNYREARNPGALSDIPVSSLEWSPDLLEIEPVEGSVVNSDRPAPAKIEESRSIKDQMYGWQVQIEYLKDVRSAIKRQMDRWERGENLNSPAALEDAKEITQATLILPNPTWHELDAEYKSVGRQIADAIREREGLRKKQEEKSIGCGFFLAVCVIAAVLYVIFSAYWT